MPRNAPPADAVQYALDGIKAGRSLEDLARDITAGGYSVTKMTVSRWRDKYGGAPQQPKPGALAADLGKRAEARAAAPAEPEAPPVDAVTSQEDALAFTRRMLADTLKRAKDAEVVGNYSAAQRAGRDASALVTVLARLEKTTADEDDAVRVSRKEIDETMAQLEERMRAICDRPLLCSECSRELSIDWGEGGDSLADAPGVESPPCDSNP